MKVSIAISLNPRTKTLGQYISQNIFDKSLSSVVNELLDVYIQKNIHKLPVSKIKELEEDIIQ
jgi:hypothetical protein